MGPPCWLRSETKSERSLWPLVPTEDPGDVWDPGPCGRFWWEILHHLCGGVRGEGACLPWDLFSQGTLFLVHDVASRSCPLPGAPLPNEVIRPASLLPTPTCANLPPSLALPPEPKATSQPVPGCLLSYRKRTSAGTWRLSQRRPHPAASAPLGCDREWFVHLARHLLNRKLPASTFFFSFSPFLRACGSGFYSASTMP